MDNNELEKQLWENGLDHITMQVKASVIELARNVQETIKAKSEKSWFDMVDSKLPEGITLNREVVKSIDEESTRQAFERFGIDGIDNGWGKAGINLPPSNQYYSKSTLFYPTESPADSITDHVVVEKSIVSRKELHNAPIEVIKQKAENAILDSFKPVERWKPVVGERYSFLSSGGRKSSSTWDNDEVDNNRWDFGNIFRTESDAIAARERVKKALSETTLSDNKFAIFEGKVVEVIKHGGKPAYIMGFDPLPPITAPPLFATREEAEKALLQ